MELVFNLEVPVHGAEPVGAVAEFAYSGSPPDAEAVDGTLEELGLQPYWELICAGCGVGFDFPPNEVTMGPIRNATSVQTSLPSA